MIEIKIIDHDNIRAFGLKNLIEKYFNLQATLLCDIPQASEFSDTPNTIYLLTPDKLLSHLDFFITKRQRTVIISTQNSPTTSNQINPTEELSQSIETLNKLISSIQQPITSKSSQNLSLREIEVLKLVAMGYINKEIADKLSISINTVLTHRKNITSKLGIRSVSGLSVYAIMNGLISDKNVK